MEACVRRCQTRRNNVRTANRRDGQTFARFAKKLSWKLTYSAAKPTSSRPATNSIWAKVCRARLTGGGRRYAVVDVVEAVRQDRKFACKEHRAGQKEIADECDVEADLFDQRVCG